jgi:hypothetical protein
MTKTNAPGLSKFRIIAWKQCSKRQWPEGNRLDLRIITP